LADHCGYFLNRDLTHAGGRRATIRSRFGTVLDCEPIVPSMRHAGLRMRSLLVLLLFPTVAVAEQHGVTGTVSGQVYCADTQHPARLAHVALVPLPPAATSPSTNKPQTPQQYKGNTRTDGSFLVTHVPPGDLLCQRHLSRLPYP
jgi:hypothetical protein